MQKSSEIVYTKNNKKIFNSLKNAQNYYNILSSSGITNCCRRKRNCCGKDPITGEYLQWQYYEDYLIKPKKLLSNNEELSVLEIAELCGFNNISNFNRKFKELKQLSPLQYRKLNL